MWGWLRRRRERDALLKDAMQRVAQGEVGDSVKVDLQDEPGVLAHTFNQMVDGLHERDRIRDTFGRYMTQQVSDAILKGDVKLGGETRVVTILMGQLREFESLVYTLGTQELVGAVNRYLATVVECVVAHGGLIDKFDFGGRMFSAIFGSPIHDGQHAANGVAAGLDIRDRMQPFNDGNRELHMDVGIATGEVVSGNIGSETRMEYSVVGGAALTAERLMYEATATCAGLLISQITVTHCGDAYRFAQLSPTAFSVEPAA